MESSNHLNFYITLIIKFILPKTTILRAPAKTGIKIIQIYHTKMVRNKMLIMEINSITKLKNQLRTNN
jgi:hypothetical protein